MSTKYLRKSTFQRKSTPFLKTFFLKEENAINLIEIKREQLILNEEALKVIKDIKENVIIVLIFGKEGTGKSYLLNLLLNSDENPSKPPKGFKVTSQTNTTSPGLWIWSTPLSKYNSKDKIIFFDSVRVDSENVYQQEMDSKLMALILLISSLFIYNTTGDINSNSLNDLELILHLTDSLAINERINKDKLIAELCPKFIWALRDFDLEKLNSIKENKISPDFYLEQCLKERFDGKKKDEINMIKENLIQYFKQRECVTLPTPVEEKDLVMLKSRAFNDLKENFKNEFLNLKDKIFNYSKPKIINGKIMNGPMIAYLLTEIVKDINDKKIPNLSDIFKEMIIYNIEKNYNQAKDYFMEKLNNLKREELNLDLKEIYSIKYEALKQYMNILEKNPEITKKEIYLKEYKIKKEQLEKELENQINEELNILMPNDFFENINIKNKENNNKEYKKKDELIEVYLNELSELKINSDSIIVNNKVYDNFVNYDIKKTKKIIDFIEKNKEYSSKSYNSINEEEKSKEIIIIDNDNDDDNYEKLKKELAEIEKNALELIGEFTNLIDKRDKYIKKSLTSSKLNHRPSIQSYSSKLMKVYSNKEKLCELSSEESSSERCNCSMDRIKNCFIY